MKVPRPYVLFPVILTSLVLANPVWDNARNDDPWGVPSLLADGGSPMPPIPPRTAVKFVADGGSPMPPIPPRTAVTFIADGGSPMPPIPPRTAVKFVADGGSPMPPVPPRFTSGSYVV